MTNRIITVNLVLGIIGTLAGLISLYIHIQNYRKNRSKIEIDKIIGGINKEDKTIIFRIILHNKGNIPTSIYKCESFVDNFMPHINLLRLKEESIPTFGKTLTKKGIEPINVPFDIRPNSTISMRIELVFYDENIFNRTINKQQINSEIIFYHTYGKTRKILKIYDQNFAR